jgi:hypothetical protein
MVKERKKRVTMTKKLEREVFMACLVRVSHGTLPVGAFKAVGESFNARPTKVSKMWHTTMKCLDTNLMLLLTLLLLLLTFLLQLLISYKTSQNKQL